MQDWYILLSLTGTVLWCNKALWISSLFCFILPDVSVLVLCVSSRIRSDMLNSFDLTCWCTFSGYWWVNFVATLSQHEALPCERLTQGGEYRGMAVQVGERSIHAGGHVTLCKRLLQKINMKAEISVDDNHHDSPIRSTWPQNISSWNWGLVI